jgi:hypothetical protein
MGVFWELLRNIRRSKNARNAETKRQSGAVPTPLLALSASTTSPYSSLGVSRESNPQPQPLKASVVPLSHISCWRVLVDGLVQEEGNGDNVDNGSYSNGISMVLGVGKNLLVRK